MHILENVFSNKINWGEICYCDDMNTAVELPCIYRIIKKLLGGDQCICKSHLHI
jgi:hypothetical protein